jgi:hypothetical protein
LRPLQSKHEGTLPHAAQPQQHSALSRSTGTADFRQGVAVNFAGSDAILSLFRGARAPAARIFHAVLTIGLSDTKGRHSSGFCLNLHAQSSPVLKLFCFSFPFVVTIQY